MTDGLTPPIRRPQLQNETPTTATEAMLKERGSRYGVFAHQADIAQGIKEAMRSGRNWKGLSNDKKEALDMLANKIARILNGDPDYADSWDDIIGYAKLVADTLEGRCPTY